MSGFAGSKWSTQEGPRSTAGALLYVRPASGRVFAAIAVHRGAAVLTVLGIAGGGVFAAAGFAVLGITAGLAILGGAEFGVVILAAFHGGFTVGGWGFAAGHFAGGFSVAAAHGCMVMLFRFCGVG